MTLPDETPPATRRALFRALQEALTNIRRHAPGAAAEITMGVRGKLLVLLVRNSVPDTAQQPPAPKRGGSFGLVGLSERAELLGGLCTSGPADDGWFEVRMELPTTQPDPRS